MALIPYDVVVWVGAEFSRSILPPIPTTFMLPFRATLPHLCPHPTETNKCDTQCFFPLAIAAGALPARADVILDSAADPTLFVRLIVGDFNWPFHRFEITQPTKLQRVGGTFTNAVDTDIDVFAAIVELSGPTDNPDSLDLTTPDLVTTTLMTVAPGTGFQTTALNQTLNPGWYALQFGNGAFGATSVPSLVDFGLPAHDIDLEPSQRSMIAIQVGHPSIPPSFSSSASPHRFFVEGRPVPEPSSLALWSLLSLGLARWRSRRTGPSVED